MNIVIRLARKDDAPIIAEFNGSMAAETEGIRLERTRLVKGVEALLADTNKGVYYVAEVDGRVVGQLMITYEWSDWRNAIFWWIQSVYVHPEFRGKGVFRKIYRHVESRAKTVGDVCGMRLYVEKGNERAHKTYESLGMKKSHYDMMDIDFDLQ